MSGADKRFELVEFLDELLNRAKWLALSHYALRQQVMIEIQLCRELGLDPKIDLDCSAKALLWPKADDSGPSSPE